MKKNKKNILVIAILFLFGSSLAPSLALGANFDYELLETIPGFLQAGKTYTFNQYVSAIYNFLIWTAGIASLFMISLGAFMYITSAGNQAALSKAKTFIVDAVIGLILVFAAWLILYTINPNLVGLAGIQGETRELGSSAGSTYSSGDAYGFPSQVTAQEGDGSESLEELLHCMNEAFAAQGKDFPVITSISDGNGGVNCYKDHPSWNQCTYEGQSACCYHKEGSCHYGGTCGDVSYAADLKANGNITSQDIINVANSCGANYTKNEGTHVHVSAKNNCNCN